MRRITDKIRDFKDNLTPILQPLTQQELYLRISHEHNSPLPIYEQPIETPTHSPYQNLKLDITIQQWTEAIAYDSLLQRVISKQLQNTQYLFELSDKENLLSTAQKRSLAICWQPCYQTMIEACHVDQLDVSLNRIQQMRDTLASMRNRVYVSHRKMKQRLIRLNNMRKYVKQLTQLKGKLRKYYSNPQPALIIEALRDQSFKKYAFYQNLMEKTHKMMCDLETQASQKLKNSLLSADCPASPYLSLIKFQSTQKIIRKAAKQAVKQSLYSIIITNIDETVYPLDNIDGILSAFQPEHVPKLLQSIFTTVTKLMNKPTQFTTQQASIYLQTVRLTATTYLRVFIQKLKYKLTCIQLNNLNIIQQMLQFSNQISDTLQQYISNTLQQRLVQLHTQSINNIPVDIESEQWLMHNMVHQCYCHLLSNLNKQKQPRQLMMVFSLFNCLRRLQLLLVHIFMFGSSRILLINQYEQSIKEYIRCLVKAYFREDVRQECQLQCPNLCTYINGEQDRMEPDESAIEALQISLQQFVEHLQQQRQVMNKVTDVVDYSLAALRDMPTFMKIVYLHCLSLKVDLSEIEDGGWLTTKTSHDELVDSIKLHYCHIRDQQHRHGYIQNIVRRIVDVLSHKKMLKENSQLALSYFEVVRQELLEVDIVLNNDINNYILARASGDNDPCRMQLAKSRVGMYTRHSLMSLAKNKHQEQQIKALLDK